MGTVISEESASAEVDIQHFEFFQEYAQDYSRLLTNALMEQLTATYMFCGKQMLLKKCLSVTPNTTISMQEIRDRLMEEEQLGGREWEGGNKREGGKKGKKHRKSEVVNTVQHSDVRRLSLPAILTVSMLMRIYNYNYNLLL